MGFPSYFEDIAERYHDDVRSSTHTSTACLRDGESTTSRQSSQSHDYSFLHQILVELESILPVSPFLLESVLKAERDLVRFEMAYVSGLTLDEFRALRATPDMKWASVDKRWQDFLRGRLEAVVNYRPRLREVGPLWLDEKQRHLVARDHVGHRRINAAAGTGKTVVLVHRAIRLLATTNDDVLLVTPNDALSIEIEEAIHTLAGLENTPRLRVRSIARIVDSWHMHTGEELRVASHDVLDREWGAFVDAADASEGHVLRSPDTMRFLSELERRADRLERRNVTMVPRWVDHRRRTWIALWRALDYVGCRS